MPSSPQPSSLEHRPVFVSGIRYDEFPFPDEDSEQVAKEHLRQQIHDVNLDQVGERLVYGNSAGLTLLGELEELKESMTLLQKRVAESETTIEGHRKEIAELQTRVGYLTASSEGYLAIRRRFLDVYKRDIKSMEELRNPRAIRNGNVVAHEGDALSDAVVFDRDRRSDRSTFRELYGLEYGQVLEFYAANENHVNDGGLLKVLNARATLVVRGQGLSDELKAAFQTFVDKVEENWL